MGIYIYIYIYIYTPNGMHKHTHTMHVCIKNHRQGQEEVVNTELVIYKRDR